MPWIIDASARRIRNGLIIGMLALTAGLAGGIVFAATPPDSGAALQAVKPQPAEPPAENTTSSITVNEPDTVPSSGDQRKIRVKGFRLSGETILPEKRLLKLIAAQAGQELTLDDLNRLAGKITAELRQQGYLVAFAYIPPQRLTDGIVEISVIPGKYGVTKINNNTRIDSKRLEKILEAVRPGTIIANKPLERVLLLLNDLAGIEAKATLKPGQTPGTADLILDMNDGPKANGSLSLDNSGNRYSGQDKAGVQLSLNNFDYRGDKLNLGGQNTGKGLANANGSYDMPLGYHGLRLNLSYSAVSYTLGEDFAALGATGLAEVAGGELSYPFIRSRTANFYGTLGFENKLLRDQISSIHTNTSRVSNLWHLGINGNRIDKWGGGGVSVYSLVYYGGYLGINDGTAFRNDAASANTAGHFSKIAVNYSRQQYLSPLFSANFTVSGQLAGKNLDSSEKFSLGGADGVRAYPQGEASGDEGLRLTAELKMRLPEQSGGKEQLCLVAFSDYGYVTVNKNPWITMANSHGLSDIGIGFIYTWNPGFYLRCDYAWKLGSEAATGDTDKPGRCWVRMIKSF